MQKFFMSFFCAIRFLTILPIPFFADKDSDYFTASVRFFPLVGLCIGAFNSLIATLLISILPLPLLCCLLIFSLSAISGFLHMDGLADTADGFFSSRPREKILEIMHDSRNGAMGIVGIMFLLLFKYCSLMSIPIQNIGTAILLMPLGGRLAIIVSMYLLSYARREGGLGKLFYTEREWLTPFLSMVFLFSAAFFVDLAFILLCLAVSFLTALMFSLWCKRKIGGATGDTLGAVCEITEMSVAFSLAVYLNS